MNYTASITDFFKAPQWGMNMLLGAVCILIPMVGPIILTGWVITQLWSRGDDELPSQYPPFDFQHFTKYLMRGLWSFLVQMAASLVMIPVFMILAFAFIFIAVPTMRDNEAISVLFMIVGFLVYSIAMLALNFILVPLSISATLSQDFMPTFNFGFVRNFLTLVWKELLISGLFMFAIGVVMAIVAFCTCYIGAFALIAVVTYAWQHLQKQLYLLHLSRGGMVLARSPKLSDLPPSLPQVMEPSA